MVTKQKLSPKKPKKKLALIGWREWISFPDYDNFLLKAKIDTGARSSALHATHLLPYENGEEKRIKFRVYQSKIFHYIDAPILGYKKVKNSFGVSEIRPIIQMKIKLGKESWYTEITLARRSGMSYPMLIGRNSLKRKHIIHPHKSFLQGKIKKSKK